MSAQPSTAQPKPAGPATHAPSARDRLALLTADIKIAHSVFALPFAILAAFLARPTDAAWSRFAGQLALIVLCMVAARTWAMLINRLADRKIDAANPRTAARPLASGALRGRDAATAATAAGLLFILLTALFWAFYANPWPLLLSVPTLAWIAFYSFTKRFTALCHLFLGGALAASPIAAAIAVEPAALADVPAVWWLAAMVVLWVAGFDVIYALQDTDFDRETGLSSIPARLGPRRAILASRALHAGALAALIAAWLFDPRLAILFGLAVLLVGALLIGEHAVLHRRGRRGLHAAFFTFNGAISCVVGLLGCLDTLLG